MSCHTFQGCLSMLNCSIRLTCYLGLQIRNAQLVHHSACFRCLNISILCCLYLTTFWQFPNKTCRNQTTNERMSNHIAEIWIRQRYCLWLSFPPENQHYTRERGWMTSKTLTGTAATGQQHQPHSKCAFQMHMELDESKMKNKEMEPVFTWEVHRSQNASLLFVCYLSKEQQML